MSLLRNFKDDSESFGIKGEYFLKGIVHVTGKNKQVEMINFNIFPVNDEANKIYLDPENSFFQFQE